MSALRIGCPCYATDQGIGILAKAFFNHGIITDPIIISHGRHQNHLEWYPGAPKINNLRYEEDRKRLFNHCKNLDVLLCIETPFMWELFPYCRRIGVRTVLVTMYECSQPHRFQDPANCPDLFICPSLLDLNYFARKESDTPAIFLPLPIDTTLVPWKQRTTAQMFVHNAGHGGLLGRNGTKELLAAMEYVQSPITLILRSQAPINVPVFQKLVPWKMLQWTNRNVPYSELYNEGDVFVFPDKFAGQSCPLEEARAAGMLVMGSNRFPHNTWLPTEIATVCNACDGEGSLMFQWAKEEMLRTGGRKVDLTGGRAHEGFYYVTSEGKEIGMKLIGGPCEVCQGNKVQQLSPLIPVSSYRRNRIGSSYNEFDEAIIDPKDIARKIDEWYGQDISSYSLSGRQFARERSWNVLGEVWMRSIVGDRK